MIPTQVPQNENLNILPSKTSNYKKGQSKQTYSDSDGSLSTFPVQNEVGMLIVKRSFLVFFKSCTTDQHIAVFHVKVQEEEEGDEEAKEGDGGAFPQTPHFVQGFPHQPHSVHTVGAKTCKGQEGKSNLKLKDP